VTSSTPHSLKLNEITISGNIGEYLDQAGRVAVFVVTVGEEISHLAESAIKNGDAFSALVMDAIGSCAVEAAADALMLHVRRELKDGEELTLRYSPGYCGMQIGQQSKLFQLVQASSVGVTLMTSMLMHPLKSISGLIGLAPKEAVSRYRSPCDLCARMGCHMRR
jgi:cobalamin-dependent methionine synthase I